MFVPTSQKIAYPTAPGLQPVRYDFDAFRQFSKSIDRGLLALEEEFATRRTAPVTRPTAESQGVEGATDADLYGELPWA